MEEILKILEEEKILTFSNHLQKYIVNSNIYKRDWEKDLCKSHPEVFKFLERFNGGLREVTFCISHNLSQPPICPFCNQKLLQFSTSPRTGYKGTCGSKDCIKASVEKTSLKKYGVRHPKNSEKVKEKTAKTNLERYGVPYVLSNKEVRKKIEKTNRENHNGFWNNQLPEDKIKRSETNRKNHGGLLECQTKEGKETRKLTNLKNLGVEYPAQSSEVQAKMKGTLLKNWGVDHPSKSSIIREKQINSLYKNYGVYSPLQSPEIKNKVINTNREKYGTDWYLGSEKARMILKDFCERNGVENVSQIEEVKQLKEEKAFEKFGVSNVSQASEIKEKKKETAIKNGFWNQIDDEYIKYRKNVVYLTAQTYLKFFDEINPDFLKRGTSNNDFQLDHKFSIAEGFKENIPEEIIASKYNLELINARENRIKSRKCSITKEELYTLFKNSQKI